MDASTYLVGEAGPEVTWVVVAPPRGWRERLGMLICLTRGHDEAYPASHPAWKRVRGPGEPNWCRRCRTRRPGH